MKKVAFLFFVSLIMVACGKDSSKDIRFDVTEPKSCSQADRNQFVYDVLKDSYLWSDKVGRLDISLETTDSAFLDHFLYKEKDRFSFILSQEDYQEHFVSGSAKDFGFLSRLMEQEKGTFIKKISYVHPNSPADKAGLIRSDRIIGFDANTSQMQLENTKGERRTVILEDFTYQVSSISHEQVFTNPNHTVGYFYFHSFVGPNLNANLDTVFSFFKENMVNDLIVDLRYNGGGYLSVSTHLGSLMGGDNVSGHIFQQRRYNTKYSRLNTQTHFDKLPKESLHLKRIFILTTYGTASASESLINSLRAQDNDIKVITIGRETFGKPYGMNIMAYCDKVLFPIQFSNENSDGVGGFVDGLTPTCRVDETIEYDFEDINESLLSEALYYIEHGQCSR